MRNLSDCSNLPDLDENQFLNGRGSVVIMAIKNKKPSRTFSNTSGKSRLMDHLKNHSALYLILAAVAVTVLVVVHIEKEYQLSINKASTQTDQLKTVSDEANSRNPTNSKSSPLFFEKSKQPDEGVRKQPVKPKEPSGHFQQTISKTNKWQTSNLIPPDMLPEKFKAQKPQQSIVQKSAKSTEVQKKPEVSNVQKKPAQQKAQKHPPKTSPSATKPVAGISQQQRDSAQKWLGLKNQNIYQPSDLADQQRKYYQQKYNISSFDELPICIVIPSYNNVKDNRHLKNIKSVVMQEYTNYHIVFIDDASSDGTGDQIESFLMGQAKIPKEKYVIVKNTEQKRAMPNLRRAAKEFCQPQDIFIIVDGDDELLGRQVLKLFNAVFQSKKAWFVYSNFLTIRGSVGYSRPFPQSTITNNKYRSYPFVTSHLRAFYTQLFMNINETDLKDDQGNYLKAANDVAICIPILQMSHQRVFYLPQLTYYYNSNTGQNNHHLRLKQQKSNDKMLRKRKSYSRLKELEFSPALVKVNQAKSSTPPYLQSLQIAKNVTAQKEQPETKNSQ